MTFSCAAPNPSSVLVYVLEFVCAEVVAQALVAGMRMIPQIVFSTDDMKAAYRQVPTRQPEMYIVCLYCFDKGNLGPRFVEGPHLRVPLCGL